MAEAAPAVPDRAVTISKEELVCGLQVVLKGKRFDDVSIKQARRSLASHFGLPETAFDCRKGEIRDLAQGVIQEALAQPPAPEPAEEESIGEEEETASKRVYLVTFSHPKAATAKDGAALRAPSSYTRKQIAEAMLDAVEKTNGSRLTPLRLQLMCVFREKHGSGALRDHLGLLAARAFRFRPLKLVLLRDYGLASHWSCTHEGYASCVAYGYMATPKKPQAELDKEAYLWPEDKHPLLEEASRAPVTAKATAAARERGRLKRSEEGKEERFEDIDVWPVVVRENIPDAPEGPDVLMAYAKRRGGPAMVKFLFRNWPKVPDLIARSWKVERVEVYVDRAKKSRMDLLEEATQASCECGGHWVGMARDLFAKNSLNEEEWRSAVLGSLKNGRSKGTLVCHAGHKGNEGKSSLLEPLESVCGEDCVFNAPPKGGFPLLGLEKCRLALLDDWRFNEDIIGYPLQLLWFEGKPIVIARPQNQCAGHLKYTKDDPIFITTLMSDITNVKGKKIEGGDVEMMLRRLKIFEFSHALEAPCKVPACGRCFARFLLYPDGAPATPKRPHAGHSGETSDRKAGCMAWSVSDVVVFLEDMGLGHKADAFRENGLDGAFLLKLSARDLEDELGLTRLQARKIMDRLPVDKA